MDDSSKETSSGKLHLSIALDMDAICAAVREAVRDELRALPVEPTGLATKQQAARAFGVSPATIDRAVREGLPYVTIGIGKRFELAACREWFAARGPKPTTQKASIKPDADTADIIEKSGLRLVAGVRR